MNPHLQTQEVKQLKFFVETQLKLTNVVLKEYKKQIQEENQNNINQNNIDCLKEIQRKQIKIRRKTKHGLRN